MTPVVSIRNSAGFTLIEVMVAVLIMTVGMLGLLTTVNVAMEHNLKNHLRDEAVEVGAKCMNELRGQGIDNIKTTYPPLTVPSKIRASGKTYSVERSSQPLASDPTGPTSVQVNVVVKWAYKNITSQNRVVSVVSKP